MSDTINIYGFDITIPSKERCETYYRDYVAGIITQLNQIGICDRAITNLVNSFAITLDEQTIEYLGKRP